MQQLDDQRFHRGTDRLLGGVCSGLAEGLHVNALWVRLAFVLLAFLQGIGLLIYVVLWLVMPERVEGGASRSGFDSMSDDVKRVWAELRGQLGASTATVTPTPTPTPPSPPPAATSSHTVPSPPPAAAAAPLPPQVAASTPPPPPAVTSAPPATAARRPSLIPGLILVLIGLFFLASNVGLVDWSVFWPAAVIIVGVVLLVRNLERKP